jgi:hypothetical protein
MLQPRTPTKVIVTDSAREAIAAGDRATYHLTAMLSHSASGAVLPPFIIFPKHLHGFQEGIQEFESTGNAWLISNLSGWMTRKVFIIWTLHFCFWFSQYRCSLPDAIKHIPAVLIMDGHTSRENPTAMSIFQIYHVRVIILPSHTSHFLQMFDVVLAGPLKVSFKTKYRTFMQNESKRKRFNTKIGLERFCMISARLASLYEVGNVPNCLESARTTGCCPFSIEPV